MNLSFTSLSALECPLFSASLLVLIQVTRGGHKAQEFDRQRSSACSYQVLSLLPSSSRALFTEKEFSPNKIHTLICTKLLLNNRIQNSSRLLWNSCVQQTARRPYVKSDRYLRSNVHWDMHSSEPWTGNQGQGKHLGGGTSDIVIGQSTKFVFEVPPQLLTTQSCL